MSLKEYEVVDDPGSPAGHQLGNLAQAEPWKASRLLTTIEDFVRDGVSAGELMAPNVAGAAVEIYLVPPRYILAYLPDAAALVRVDHAQKKVEFVELYDACGGPGYAWGAIEARAAAALVGP